MTCITLREVVVQQLNLWTAKFAQLTMFLFCRQTGQEGGCTNLGHVCFRPTEEVARICKVFSHNVSVPGRFKKPPPSCP